MINYFKIIMLGGLLPFLVCCPLHPELSLLESNMPKGVYDHWMLRKNRFCEIEDCNEKHYCKGLCRKHYLEDNKEHIAKRSKKYNQDNKEKTREYRKQYNQDNAEHRFKYNKQYYQDHKEHEVKRIKKYQQANKKHIVEYKKQWYKTLAGKASNRAQHCNRRAKTKDLTTATILRVYEANIAKYGVLTCYLCGKPIINNDDSLEHSTPVTRQGTSDYENLGIAHKSCNSEKHTKTLEEWFGKDRRKK